MIFGLFVMKNLKLALKFRNFWKFLEKNRVAKTVHLGAHWCDFESLVAP